jgi:DNA-binding winged helix-turn-helix (wHTH) protein/TolB-like protein/tetratricopeptide (TPR) repeat protein
VSGARSLKFSGFELDQRRAELRSPTGEVLKLRRKSFELLQLLAAHAGEVLSKDAIITAVWPNVYVGEDSLYQCIREVRAALGDDQREIIKVVSGRGYLFTAKVTVESDPESVAHPPAGDTVYPAGAAPVAANAAAQAAEIPALAPPQLRGSRYLSFRRAIFAGAVAVVGAAALAFAAPLMSSRTVPQKPVIAVTPFVASGTDADVIRSAANLTDRVMDGLSGIPNIRVLAPAADQDVEAVKPASGAESRAGFVLRGELQRTPDAWLVQARLISASTGEVQWSTSHSVPVKLADPNLRQSRLAAGIGYPLAVQISETTQGSVRAADAQVAVDQALAAIRRNSRDNFATAQTMLEKALASRPDDVDLQMALSAHLLRGVMLVWYPPAEAAAAERRAGELLEQAVARKPDYLPVLQAHCRFLLTATEFTQTLVTCAKALRFNPWDGLVMFHIGMAQLQLARFDDGLASFEQADRADVPQVSRWTWLLGAGVACLLMDRNEEAIAWMQRSLAITQGTGRTHFMLAVALQRLGRTEEAKQAIATGLKLRPGSTATNIALPRKNQSALYVAKADQIKAALLQAGMPDGGSH